ncbi:MAG: hypothetical protein JNJ71_10035 [Rubrivivax sp.]|nr:hypothetical protein [Rubrivivax sp.]
MSTRPSLETHLETRALAPRPGLRRLAALLLSASVAVIAACGGGGDAAPTGGGTAAAERATAFAAGPISGFGSVIVNGVRFDDSGAVVTDDDDRARSRDQLRLGMMVELEGAGVNAGAGTGRALRIRFGSEIVGPVTAVDSAAGTLTVLGQKVAVTASTVFDDSLAGGLAGISTASVLEVHAQFNATDGSYTAMRVEDATSATTYKLRGLIAGLDTTAKTFSVGGQVISYGQLAAADVPASLANGQRVRVRLQTTQVNGQWVATAVRTGVRQPDDGVGAHLRGPITAFSSASEFEVNGLKVDASKASFPDGVTGIVLGAVVEVKGSVSAGTLVATTVELDGRHAPERHRFELHGSVSALNTTAKTFKLRNVTVSYAGSVTWKDGAETDLADGKRVSVKGTPSADRTQLVATQIDFE